jgi:RTX calcium-binding nonapeptide repeat (4 copies)
MLIFSLICFIVFPAFPVASAGIVTGNDFRNYLFGTMDADTILGKGANDRLHGLAGADIIRGGSGDDILEGDQGNDNLSGDDGNDIIIGGQDADTLLGGNGDDIIMASYAINSSSIRDFVSDSIMCGLGNDTAYINIEDNDTASGDCENVISTSSFPYLPPINTTSLEASNSPSSESNNSFNSTSNSSSSEPSTPITSESSSSFEHTPGLFFTSQSSSTSDSLVAIPHVGTR